VASSVQWFKCFGTFRPKGNTKKPKNSRRNDKPDQSFV